MGSMIILGINKMEIDWGKNTFFNNHSKLFQKEDFDKLVDYYYIDNDDNEVVEHKKGAKKKLSDIKERLEILGYDMQNVKKKYMESIKEYEFYTGEKGILTFKELCMFIKSIDISKVDSVFYEIDNFENGYDLGEYFKECILRDKEVFSKISKVKKKIDKNFSTLGEFFENIDPYIILRILAENKENLDYFVEWHYDDVIENGWVRREDVIMELEAENKILIVTEGKSDSFIIKKSLESLYPNIADFFEFIDMEANYPFTGVGNLSNFCLGLSKINIQNNIIVLFDNDTAGIESYNKVKDIQKPRNLLICHLPEYREFNKFDSVGPFGRKKVNINGKAVAIECFLDLSTLDTMPVIRWNNYNKNMNQYQGELENKEAYIRKFKNANLDDGTYNCEKLKFLIDYIIKCWLER